MHWMCSAGHQTSSQEALSSVTCAEHDNQVYSGVCSGVFATGTIPTLLLVSSLPGVYLAFCVNKTQTHRNNSTITPSHFQHFSKQKLCLLNLFNLIHQTWHTLCSWWKQFIEYCYCLFRSVQSASYGFQCIHRYKLFAIHVEFSDYNVCEYFVSMQ